MAIIDYVAQKKPEKDEKEKQYTDRELYLLRALLNFLLYMGKVKSEGKIDGNLLFTSASSLSRLQINYNRSVSILSTKLSL